MAGLRALRTPTVGEKAEKILSYFAHKYPKPGELIDFHENIVSPEMLSIGWAIDHRELDFLILSYLYLEKEFFTLVEIETERMIGSKKEQFRMISPKGWAYLDSLRQGNLQSQIGFIAMWFDESMNEARLAIEKGIRVAGYEPLRIDQKQHNNKIDDEIVAAIRQSKFVVADFTKQRGGVYFEAGFARGLDLEVIWLCRQDELKEVHFDTRQYNFIVWETDKLPELSKNLQNRIEATIGRGTLQ